MRIKNLTISNILSIESATILFPENGLLLIDGWNHDTQSANGAGKSSIFHALSWGIYGRSPREVSVGEFVRHGAREAKVTVDIELAKDRVLRVERGRPKSLRATLNDTGLTDNEYEELIPIDYDQFMLAQYFAQGLGVRFLDLADTARKDLLLKLMRADGFAESRKNIEADIKRLLIEKNNIINSISSISGRLSAYKESVVDTDDLQSEISALEKAINDVIPKMEKLSRVKPPSDIDKFSEMIDKLNNKLREVAVSNGKLKAYRQQLSDLRSIKDPVDSCDGECPGCGIELDVLPSGIVKHDSSSFSTKLEAHRRSVSDKIESLTASIVSLDAETSKESSILETISSLKKKIKDSTTEYDAAQSRLSELKAFIREKDIEHKNLIKTIDQQRDLNIKINQLNENLLIHKSNLEKISDEITRLEVASSILSPTGAPAYVMDAVIQSLNDRIQEIIQLIWPNSSYELLSFRENKSGSVTSKMSDSLTIDGSKRSIGSLSGGERRCLSLCIDFAISEVVSRYTGAILNPLILDEPFDHLDNANRARVIEFLKEMAADRCIVVIDHASEAKALFDESITITKRNGISVVS